jgi:hypothetical protein
MTDDLDRLPVLEALEVELARVRPAAAGAASRGRLLRVATPATAAIVAAAMALTPGGRALAERIGELVGIGDEPTRSSLGLIDEPAIVIGAGESPNGTAYEVVASADMNIYRDESPETCVGIDFPGSDAPSNAGCLTGELSRSIDERVITPTVFLGSAELGRERLIVDGLASPEVVSAEVERVAEDGSIERHPVAVSHLTGELAREIGASREATFLLAFLPEDLVPPPPAATDPQPSFAIPAPAPGTIPDSPGAGSEAGPVIGRDIPVPTLPGDHGGSPARAALARLSLVAYDGDGSEIARESLARQPFSEVTLYSAGSGTAADGRDQAVLERCFRQVLPRYGTPGEIPPQLPRSFGEELGECQKRAAPRPAAR